MKQKLIILTICFLGLIPKTHGQNAHEFQTILDECGMNFTKPSGLAACVVVDNHDMEYDFALKYPDNDFEVRYAIRPIQFKTYVNDTLKREIESQIPFRNTQYGVILQTVILNITGGNDYPVQAFDSEAVKQEFNADWGATTFVELNSGFGKGYKFCMIVAIHKDNVADAYYFYLSNTKEHFMELVLPIFHSLRFD